MDKILVTFEVPSVGLRFDAQVPPFIPVAALRPLLYPLLEELTNGAYAPSGEEILCRRDDRRVLPMEVSLEDAGVQAGDRLLLF